MVIVHLIPALQGGGAERQLSILAAEQSRRGATVYVGTRRTGHYEGTLRAAGVTVRLLGDGKFLSPGLLKSIHGLLGEAQPQIVQTWLPQMDVLGGACTLLRRIPWVLSERASPPAYAKPTSMIRLRRLLGPRASAVVANSTAGADYWRAQMRVPSHIYTVPNALDVAAIRAASGRGAAGPTGAGKLVLVVGRLDRDKAVGTVIAAVARAPASQRMQMLILGDGPSRDALQQQIRNLGLAERVVMRPYEKSWWELLGRAAVLVSVSRNEGQPNVVLEAMAGGCPLIVSDIPAHREILSESSASFVPLDDPPAVAAALTNIFANPGAARTRAERASERAATLTLQASATAYESIYKHLTAGVQHKCAQS